jgi:hypothetical protein
MLLRDNLRKVNPIELFNFAKYQNFHETENFLCPNKAAEFLDHKINIVVDQFAPLKTFRIRQNTYNTLSFKSKDMHRKANS